MKIIVTAKSVYGETKLYPANSAANHLADIAKTATLTPATLRSARAMGCEIIVDGDATLAAMFRPLALGGV